MERAFRKYLECGIFAHGFARARCDDCGHDFFVAFSCNMRRMAETAAHLTDNGFPHLRGISTGVPRIWWPDAPDEELHRLGCPCPASDTASTLMQNALGITIHGGWPSKRWFGSFVTTILSIPWPATSLSLQIQMLTPATSTLWGLSKCHSGKSRPTTVVANRSSTVAIEQARLPEPGTG